jgi:hypothetical protein
LPEFDDMPRQPVGAIRNQKAKKQKDEPHSIPVKATIFSASFFFMNFILFGFVQHLENLTIHQRGLAVQFLTTILLILKSSTGSVDYIFVWAKITTNIPNLTKPLLQKVNLSLVVSLANQCVASANLNPFVAII